MRKRRILSLLAICGIAMTASFIGEATTGVAANHLPSASAPAAAGGAMGDDDTSRELPSAPAESSPGTLPDTPVEPAPAEPLSPAGTASPDNRALVRQGTSATRRVSKPADADPIRRYGTLQSTTARLPSNTAAGIDLATVDVVWKRFEPVEGRIDAAYVKELRDRLMQFRAAGADVVLSTGVQYPPEWLFAYPHSRFVNQYGDVYASPEVGKKIANMVFNQLLRDKQQNYLALLFETFGTDFYGVRLGGGWYGELNYPEHTYGGRTNAYWGFDPVASGAAPGLPSGMQANPVPGWLPGTPSADHDLARRFADWYLGSLQNYHDWQIATVRQWYPGNLLMMYPSWGVRPGQLDAAVATDLSGTTPAERNGEIPRGFDFARYIRGITDPGVVVYTTWLNADASADSRPDMRYWSPVKYLANLAADRPRPLAVMGENTGRDSVTDMTVSFEQARAYQLHAVVWAFESELYGGVHASITDYAAAIRADRAG